MAYDFSGLTPRQQQLLAAGGWRASIGMGKQPTPHTVRKLVERGLLVAEPRRFMLATITEYRVPADVSAAWRDRAATQAAALAA